MSSSARISPTAHYTGYVWARNRLSHPALQTRQGRLMFEAGLPLFTLIQLLGGASLESYLLARHRGIDVLLERAIEEHGVTQVIEVACGLSPRGWRFTQRYGERLTYVEADLPEMAARKRDALFRIGSLGEHHRVEEVDALLDGDSHPPHPGSLAALASDLDPGRGLAIVTEGLLGYLPSDVVDGIWQRIARALTGFAHGRYISDLHMAGLRTFQVRAFRVMLSAFVRGQVHLHFENAPEAESALVAAGFKRAKIHQAVSLAREVRGPGAELAHILEASTG